MILSQLPKCLSPTVLVGFLLFASVVFAQKQPPVKSATQSSDAVRGSAAYAEVLLKRTDLESELESLLLDYTDEFPRVKELRFSLTVLQRDAVKMLATKAGDAGRLTQALGKLIVRRVDLETDVWELLQSYKDEHPDVKRAKRRVEIYDRAIKQIID
jgi:hypothetical protein